MSDAEANAVALFLALILLLVEVETGLLRQVAGAMARDRVAIWGLRVLMIAALASLTMVVAGLGIAAYEALV